MESALWQQQLQRLDRGTLSATKRALLEPVQVNRQSIAPSGQVHHTHAFTQRVLYVLVGIILLCAIISLYRRWKYIYMAPSAMQTMALTSYPYRTGDLILVSTRARDQGFFNMSCMIKLFCGSPWNHVGVVYVDPHTQEPYIWEMVGSGLPRLIPMTDVPDDPFHADYFIRPLLNATCDNDKFMDIVKRQWTDIFNYDVMMPWYGRHMDMITFARGVRWNEAKHKTCSQLAAEVYHYLGVMDYVQSGVDVSELFPADYAADLPAPYGKSTHVLPMIRGATFGPLVKLTFRRRAKSKHTTAL